MDNEVLRDALHTRQIDSNISKELYTYIPHREPARHHTAGVLARQPAQRRDREDLLGEPDQDHGKDKQESWTESVPEDHPCIHPQSS